MLISNIFLSTDMLLSQGAISKKTSNRQQRLKGSMLRNKIISFFKINSQTVIAHVEKIERQLGNPWKNKNKTCLCHPLIGMTNIYI
ncbi:hypothetical protein BpHYR1_054127 [Brachionus plicatilis]|uniref:Uncharacterized protein n=1 Tax=Brachionus plicatilis TaxID=10195 RepID=A0A3M7SMH0_BRAPC|nr:hypothetical protein BpHYR1_054127 [Brachionus plicatilis]